jgi:Zn-dependent protease with chaperone function/uncharacterized tellurite resistance protein B-like protein
VNFFARQTETRTLSRRLVFLFVIAVIAVVVAVDLVMLLVIGATRPASQGVYVPNADWYSVHPQALIGCSLIVLGIISLASLYKTSVLSSGGGGAVARGLGGVRVSADTSDPTLRKLLNVVEEIAIASGVPMPEVYVLEQEAGINAFAAGHNPSNAAITVTRGALLTLDRSELQGVIAHEFSHVLNGDMRLNIRLMGLLFGLLVIALIARTVLRFGPRSGRSDRKGGAGVIVIAALAIMIVGYVGLFFGRLIQAAIARSRESLADASAVQFTRDPTGLRGALIKIGALEGGSQIGDPNAEEVAHMLFAPGVARFFATHPDLISRIKAIDPHFDKSEFAAVRAKIDATRAHVEAEAATPAKPSSAERLQSLMRGPAAVAPAVLSGLVGNPGTEHMTLARELRSALPPAIVAAGQQSAAARALLIALALDRGEPRERQLRFIAQELGVPIAGAVTQLLPEVDALSPELRMPAVLRSFPALRQFTREERIALVGCLNAMVQREGQVVSIESYVLRKLTQVQLRDDLDPRVRQGALAIGAAVTELQVLFSVLAQEGNQDAAVARQAYEAGMQALFPRAHPQFSVPANWPRALDAALNRLDLLQPAAKQQLVEALLKTIASDGKLAIEEAELLRAVCASIHCPLPPLVDSTAAA